jgi:hypothetical protein
MTGESNRPRSKTAGPQKDDPTGTWWFVVDTGTAPDGKRRQAKRRGFPTKKAAAEALDKLRVDSRQGTFVQPHRQTLADFLVDQWLPTQRRKLATSTLVAIRTECPAAHHSGAQQDPDPSNRRRRHQSLLRPPAHRGPIEWPTSSRTQTTHGAARRGT